MNQYWRNVIDKLKEKQLTQAELGRRLDIAKGTIQNWIKFDRYPPADRAVSIAEELDTSVESLVKGRVREDDQLNKRITFDKGFKQTVLQLAELDCDRFKKIQGMIELYHSEYQTEDQKRAQNA